MRCLLRVSFNAENGNKVIKNGTLPRTMKEILSEIKPEASYFTTDNGERSAFLVVNINEASDIIKTIEPFFLALNATVHVTPVMTGEDLEKGFHSLEGIVNKYGR